jgi:hypothetical protein
MSAVPAAPHEPVAHRGIRNPLARWALTAALVVGMQVAGVPVGAAAGGAIPSAAGVATPGLAAASAAMPSGEVMFCFRQSNGSAFSGDVSARVEVDGRWQTRETRRSVSGCFTWPVESGFYWRFHAHAAVGKVQWSGTTRPVYVKSGTRHDAGVYVVSQTTA